MKRDSVVCASQELNWNKKCMTLMPTLTNQTSRRRRRRCGKRMGATNLNQRVCFVVDLLWNVVASNQACFLFSSSMKVASNWDFVDDLQSLIET